MPRADDGLPFLLQYENVAWYSGGEVQILDRRVYPSQIVRVVCKDVAEVAQAITDMVTQSAGPRWAAAYAMVLAARKASTLPAAEATELIDKSTEMLASARPTTSARMREHLSSIASVAKEAILAGEDVEAVTLRHVREQEEQSYQMARRIAENTLDLIPQNGRILTQCYAETYIGMTLLLAKASGKNVSLITPETRPYLQGSRLTASVAYDLGIPVTVITDNMPGHVLSQGKVDLFISAADVITMDGHVVNKIGTFQIALAADHFGIPYYAQGRPAREHASIDSVTIEERDPEEVLHFRGIRTAKEGVQGYYPAFDITPPALVKAIITPKGVLPPQELHKYGGDDTE
ncbi:MAG: s-methyl-5-thioribose-1-phosphate isomerase [Anaerolineales bacterium]|nr:s-methyl-5-thioribose-1-phosphate isomerase [Anaerolineales bacterium]